MGWRSPSSCLPLECLAGCCTSAPGPRTTAYSAGTLGCTPSSSSQEGQDLKVKWGVTRAFARALPPPSFPPSLHWPPSRPPPRSLLRSPCPLCRSGIALTFLLPETGEGFFSVPAWGTCGHYSVPSPGQACPTELGKSASLPAAPLASFCPPPTALQDEKWEDSR